MKLYKYVTVEDAEIDVLSITHKDYYESFSNKVEVPKFTWSIPMRDLYRHAKEIFCVPVTNIKGISLEWKAEFISSLLFMGPTFTELNECHWFICKNLELCKCLGILDDLYRCFMEHIPEGESVLDLYLQISMRIRAKYAEKFCKDGLIKWLRMLYIMKLQYQLLNIPTVKIDIEIEKVSEVPKLWKY